MGRRAIVATAALALVLALALGRCRSVPPPPVRVATFNIEQFPMSDAQVAGAFDEIARLDASAIAVQEIFDPERFAREATARLGPAWQFVHAETMPEGSRYRVHVGVVYDARLYDLVSTALHDETRIDGRHKPTFEVRLRSRADDRVLQIFVVHFKSGSDYRSIRALQFRALGDLVARERVDRTVVLGDFNATDDAGDRDDLARLAVQTRLVWTTEALPCSAFWDRDDGCPTSRLDHVLAWHAGDAVAHGACAEGCELRDRCPLYNDEVSDHCPVEVTIAP